MQIKLNQKTLKPIIIFSLSICLFLLINSRAVNWQFYSDESIGPNNKLEIFDNLSFDDDLIIFSSQNNNTYALKQNTGNLVWEFTAQNYSPFPATIIDDSVYLANFDGTFIWLDPQTGLEVESGSVIAGNNNLLIPDFETDLALKITYKK
ncbi:MAG: hypothetical protein A2383_00740 [Candidatus Pacebacteria bacterium RIFOXYB1_FULL_39_46]|nr:MAG: hypothetical protein A2182_00575 [Candidatus Pacebacteria bacterium RIFOXYA1_FULL_38_18]OGJ38114.1 MAG: hypothetical protein A2383_00740 [Candidatus Pacebacteria bacterium RIFOXYB1_FULL_39_46]OGJ39664.1 MAG: hypothetical protein A2411_02700 [Candidatus Pacebacteria bacterium RIFOXYC1_FULL_39_21]OGJ39866.1 MAG: hypothetical protein A2582_00505 [Candidatus Pacebacteria bacterium RIFOXYD1_FULL_39_27]